MDCPNCDKPGAYTGLQWIHCQNTECRYYDARYTAEMKQERALQSMADANFHDKVEKLILLRGEVDDDAD